MYTKITTKNGTIVDCYGELLDDSNFEVICEDEEFDSVWCDGNPDSEDFTFKNWQEVINVLSRYYDSEIVEITAV